MTLDPQPTNPIGWLIALVLGFMMYFAGVDQSAFGATPDEPPQAVRPPVTEGRPGRPGMIPGMPDNASLLYIESLDVVTRESFPPQVTIEVSGYWPDGCNIEPQIVTEREGNVIQVRIFRIVPPGVMCTQVLTPYQTVISIDEVLREGGEFRSGDYVIDVNGTQIEVKL